MTIEEFIKTEPQKSITIQKLHYPMVISGPINDTYLRINYESIINKYYSEFRNFFAYIDLLDPKDVSKYRNNPKALSYELYGTIEYWWLLLQCNEMRSASEFTKTHIKVITKKALKELCSIILRADKDIIDQYTEEANRTARFAQSTVDVGMS